MWLTAYSEKTFIKSLRLSSKENVILPYKTTLICDRFFLESKIIVDKIMENYIFLYISGNIVMEIFLLLVVYFSGNIC